MGQYATHQVISKELRASAFDMDAEVRRMLLDAAVASGYTPAGEPVVTWYEITQPEVDLTVSCGGPVDFRAGDWRVRAVLDVAEDEEVAPVR